MNMNRLRPTGVSKGNLDAWLSSVIHDACRDAQEAGMSDDDVYQLLVVITKQLNPQGWREPR